MQRRPTAKSDSSSRRPDAECGRHADGRNRAGEYESQSAAQGGRRWRAHRNRRRPFLRTNTKTHKTTVGNTDNASVVIRIFLSLPLNGKQRTTKTESNATQTQNRSGRRLLRARHAALSRLHRHAPRVVRLAGAHPVPAGPAGRERRRRSGARRRHAAFRPRLLLGRLPAGRDAGRHIAPRRPTHEEPLPLLARENGAALHRAGPLHRRTRGRHRLTGRTAGPVQRLRPHRAEPAGSALGMGQQPAGLLRRTHRQLRLLSHRRLGAQCGDLRRSGRDFRSHRRAGLAQRPHVVQHRLSRGYGTGLPRALLAAAPRDRPRKVRRLQPLRTQLQGVVHRRRTPPDRLQPLRGLHGLHRHLSQKRHRLRTAAENPQAGEGREERVGKRGEPRRSFAPQFSVAYGHIRRTHGTPCTGEAHRRRAGRHRTEKNSPPWRAWPSKQGSSTY